MRPPEAAGTRHQIGTWHTLIAEYDGQLLDTDLCGALTGEQGFVS